MKKILPALIFILLIAAGGAAVYLVQKPAHAGAAAATAAYLPADTMVLLSLPALEHTCGDWKTTDLYKIWTEPEVQAFLAKPLSKYPTPSNWNETWEQVARLDPTNLFVALTSLDAGTNYPHVVAGFQFKGTSADVDHLLAGPKDQLKQSNPSGKADLVAYEGHTIETYDMVPNQPIASVYVGNWYLVGNDVALLKSTIDRIEHRAPADAPTLDKDPTFQTVVAKLPVEHETLIYARIRPFADLVFNLAAASGQAVDPKQRAAAEKLQAVGATSGIENGKIRDELYLLAPDAMRDLPTLKLAGLPLATADTILYAAGVYQLPTPQPSPGAAGAPDPLAALAAAGGPLAGLQQLFAMLQAHGVTLDGYRAGFGSEATLQLDWPAGQMQPTLLVSVDVRDPAAAAKFVDNLTNALSAEDGWQTIQADGRTFHSLSIPNFSALSPTLTATDRHFIFGLNPPEVEEAARHDKAPGPNFTASENYKTATALVGKPNVAFSYVDTKTLFERSYGVLKPMAVLGSAFLFPQANEYVDLSKLPEAETIARHLSPMVYSQTADDHGLLVQSVGPVTFGQAAFGLVGGVTALAAPLIGSQFNGAHGATFPGPAGGVPPTLPPPVKTPGASPTSSPQTPGGE